MFINCYSRGREESTFLRLDPTNLFITFFQDPCKGKQIVTSEVKIMLYIASKNNVIYGIL